ncbi:beta-N-acetylhexosaminidase [Saccharicrinis sp. 156]|uniref:beta-N-acetylhexosaminidase n=1 Tax=Saccharicrinis sp. 156 TaxID=3417574 RepID=UPI003D3487EF
MKKILSILAIALIALAVKAQEKSPAFIPQPESVVTKEGSFLLSSNTTVYVPTKFKSDFQPYIGEKLLNDTGIKFQVKSGTRTPASNYILFDLTKDKSIAKEGYQLDVSSHSIIIKANTYAGLFYGFQTLRQTIPVNTESFELPCLVVKDHPRFEWRGMMLDVSRHFQSKEWVKKQIDIFAAYKMNKMHWHLTDDQGWRIEIDKYPNLTKKGAWRADRSGIAWWSRELASPEEPKTIGGFYTKEDIKEVIEYARVRNVEIIPEIDVPGHSKALIASYPHLCCVDSANFEVATGGKAPDNALCAGKETTYEFLDNVLTEVAELFPSEYLHIGGDECNKTNWKKCPLCQQVMKDNDLKDEEELQSHFIQRVNKLVTSKGKTMIGWDEILSGKGAQGATIMAWRRNKYTPHIDAPKGGYPTIQASYNHSYIAQVQGPTDMEPEGPKVVLPLWKVYSYEPIPEELTAAEAKLVKGTEACLWGEFTPTESHSEYMLYPRSFANAEVAWSQPELKDWARFQGALEAHFPRLDRDKINYSTSMYTVYAPFAINQLKNEAIVYLETEMVGYDIYYTLNGDEPTTDASKYEGVFKTKPRTLLKAGLFDKKGNLLGKVTEVRLK